MYRRKKRGWLKHFDFMVLDMLCLEFALIVACMVRNGICWPFDEDIYARLGVVIILIHVCAVFFLDSYKNIVKRGCLVEIKLVIKHNTVLLFAVLAYLFGTKQGAIYSRIIITLMWIFGCCIMTVVRFAWKCVVRRMILIGKEKRTVLLIADFEHINEIIDTLKRGYYEDFCITGVVVSDKDMTGKIVNSKPVVASIDTVLKYIQTNVIDEVFIALIEETYIEHLIDQLINMGVIVHIQLAPFGRNVENRIVEHFGSYTVLSLGTKFANDGELMLKRIMDIVGSLVGLLITGVIFIVFAPIIYFQSPGPIFFTQNRVGRNGREFKLFKFRSMYLDAEERKKELMEQNKMTGLMFKMDDDPRIIPIGKFMRRASLDEFPQFWNVLMGDMSLVGTRPPTVDEYKQYELYHKKRLAIKPGITGMWQVSGRSDITDFEEVVKLDTDYIEKWNFGLDVVLIIKTVILIFTGKGAE